MIAYSVATALFALALAPFSFSQVTGIPPPCVETCGEQAITASGSGCGSLSNTTCICNNQMFLQTAATCATMTCDASDLVSAETFFMQLCGTSISNLPSGIFSGPSSTAAKQSSAAGSSSSSEAPQSTQSSGSVVSTAASPSSNPTASSNSTTSAPATSTTPSSAVRLAMSVLALAGSTLCASFIAL